MQIALHLFPIRTKKKLFDFYVWNPSSGETAQRDIMVLLSLRI